MVLLYLLAFFTAITFLLVALCMFVFGLKIFFDEPCAISFYLGSVFVTTSSILVYLAFILSNLIKIAL